MATTEERVSRLEGAYEHLATKADVEGVRVELATFKGEMLVAVVNVRSDIAALRGAPGGHLHPHAGVPAPLCGPQAEGVCHGPAQRPWSDTLDVCPVPGVVLAQSLHLLMYRFNEIIHSKVLATVRSGVPDSLVNQAYLVLVPQFATAIRAAPRPGTRSITARRLPNPLPSCPKARV